MENKLGDIQKVLIFRVSADPVLSIVNNVDDISESWARLKATWDTKMLLSRKIACVDKQESLSKTKGSREDRFWSLSANQSNERSCEFSIKTQD